MGDEQGTEGQEPEMCRQCNGTGDSWPLGAACGFCQGTGEEQPHDAQDGDA